MNLAVALAGSGKLRVGLVDADVYGPSIPTMMNLQGEPAVGEGTATSLPPPPPPFSPPRRHG